MYYIYRITNIVNGLFYIGRSQNPEKRLKQHKNENSVLGQAIRQFGLLHFTLDIIDQTEDWEEAHELERHYIETTGAIELGYNQIVGSAGFNEYTDETRRKMGDVHRGLPLSEETKRKISLAHRGSTHSEETKRKIRKNHKGMEGRTHSEETKRKLREANLGKKHSAEAKAKMRISALRRGKRQKKAS